jgi:hypothetical protein
MKIDIKVYSSIQDSAYTANLFEIENDYGAKFHQDGLFEIELCEHISQDGLGKKSELNISDDGTVLNGKIYFSRFWNNKGKRNSLTELPTPEEVYRGLFVFLDDALIRFNTQFPEI